MATPDARELGLELEEDRGFQAGLWVAQRIAWLVFLGIVALALAGFTGRGGPFAGATVQSAESSVDYPRVTRWEAPDEVQVHFGGGAEEGVVEIAESFFDVFAVTSIQPAPDRSVATPDGQRLTFTLAPGQSPRTITLHVRALRPAIPLRTSIRIGNGQPVGLTSVVLP